MLRRIQGEGTTFTVGRTAICCDDSGNECGNPQEAKDKSTSCATPWHLPEGLDTLLHRHQISHVHCCSIHSSREMETTYSSFNQQTENENVAHMGWRDGSGVKSTGRLVLSSIPSNHIVAHTIYNEIWCPLLACMDKCRQNTVYILNK